MNEIAGPSYFQEEERRSYAVASSVSKNDIECQETRSGKIHFLHERWLTHILESLTTFIDADVRSDERGGVL